MLLKSLDFKTYLTFRYSLHILLVISTVFFPLGYKTVGHQCSIRRKLTEIFSIMLRDKHTLNSLLPDPAKKEKKKNKRKASYIDGLWVLT